MAGIIIDHIVKAYGSLQALDDISLEVKEGELFGLIGPDGAGKSTLFKILTTLLLADKGTATVNGKDVVKDYRSIRNSIGYMPGRFSLYQDLSILENINFFATIFGTSLKENYDLIKEVYEQLAPFKDRRAGQLSGGMKQKLALCCALIHRPEALFLDEPTTGVDPVSRKETWDILKNLKAKGITMMVSTPYMDEAARCDRIALIQKGKLLSVDTPEHIRNNYEHQLFAVKAKDIYRLILDLRDYNETISCYAFGEYAHLTATDTVNIEDIKKYCESKGHPDIMIKKIEPGIEDRFMQLMNQTNDDGNDRTSE